MVTISILPNMLETGMIGCCLQNWAVPTPFSLSHWGVSSCDPALQSIPRWLTEFGKLGVAGLRLGKKRAPWSSEFLIWKQLSYLVRSLWLVAMASNCVTFVKYPPICRVRQNQQLFPLVLDYPRLQCAGSLTVARSWISFQAKKLFDHYGISCLLPSCAAEHRDEPVEYTSVIGCGWIHMPTLGIAWLQAFKGHKTATAPGTSEALAFRSHRPYTCRCLELRLSSDLWWAVSLFGIR